MTEKNKISKILYIFAIFIAIIIHILSNKLGFSELVNKKSYDILTSISFDKKTQKSKTIVVKIDSKSIEALGQWPWSRLVMAKLIQDIQKAHPASIGVDIIFAEQDRTSPKILSSFYKKNLQIDANFSSIPQNFQDNDIILSKILAKPNIVTSIIATNSYQQGSCEPKNYILYDKNINVNDFFQAPFFICNTANIQNSLNNSGFINAHLSVDGLLRKYILAYLHEDKLIPSLGVAMLKSVDKNIDLKSSQSILAPYSMDFLNYKIHTNKNGEVLNYIYESDYFKSISAVDVLRKNVDKSLFLGKFVIIGTTAAGLSSSYVSQDGKVINGLFAHASFIENVLQKTLLFVPKNATNILYICAFLLTLLMIHISFKYSSTLSITLSFLIVLALFSISYSFLSFNIYLPFGYFFAPYILSYFFVLSLASYVIQKREKDLDKQIAKIRSSIINQIMAMVETRDAETGNHIIRTKEFAKILSTYLHENTKFKEELSLKTINNIYQATPLHDIGKIGIPDYILQKPGLLTKEEMDIMKNHPQLGYDMLLNSSKGHFETNFFQITLNIIYTHHEKWDGTGYPNGLSGNDIPLEGRITAICDVYDALTTKRYYKEAYSFEKARQIIIEEKGTHFDPAIVEAFLDIEDQFIKVAKKYTDN